MASNEAPYRLSGLEAPAEIRIDEWGVPHIYAGTHYDAFFAQGFNAARDRLWQIDLWRRRGLGRLAEVLGPSYVAQDRAARLFLFRGEMYREWLAYGSDAKRIAEAFTAGINAYIDLLTRHPELTPPEFDLLGYAPARWAPEDVVRIRSHGLWRNVTSEVKRARVICDFDPATDALRKVLEPPHVLELPEGLDPCEIPADVLKDYRLAKAAVTFEDAVGSPKVAAVEADDPGLGSNNWAVAPSRTNTGRPIFANDPHRSHAVPSLRYVAHLKAPGLDVIGAGEPALPGISIGHNDRIAFGLTIFAIDQEDLYVYEIDAEHPGRYRYRDAWEPFERVTEIIGIRDAAPESVELLFTRHGPVVRLDPSTGHAFAVRAAWLEPGMAPYFGSVEYMRAQNWREFVAALNRWGAPSENQVYADVDGNVGYKPAGLFPIRRGWDGLLPVPGDGRYEWQGYFDMDVLPVELNPSRGFVSSANAMQLPPDYPIDRYPIGFEWSAPWRHQRIREVLAAQPRHTLDDSLALQRDYVSRLTRRVVATLPDSDDPGVRLLRSWDGQLLPDSAPAALFSVWYNRHLVPALAAAATSPAAAAEMGPIDSLAALALLEDSEGQNDALLLETVAQAYADTEARLGADAGSWRWGDLHTMSFQHPLLNRATPELRARMAYPAYPRGGSGNTPNATSYSNDSFEVRSGASFRVVLDVGNWDAARMTNAPGQSGDPRSAFYGSLLEGWATDQSFPLLYSDGAVADHTVEVIRLVPEP